MATQSAALQGAGADEKLLREGTELSQPVAGTSQTQAADGSQQNLPFMTPEPIREDQVQNAVMFLSHPKVRGSPVIYRRSFLQRKGLTKDEIDEAFNRVPDPSPNSVAPDSGASNMVSTQPGTLPNLQPQEAIQLPHPESAQAGAVSLPPAFQQRIFNWSHALIAIGVISASGAGTAVLFKKVILPRLKTWIRRVVAEGDATVKKDKSSRSLAEETAEAAKEAASAAGIVAAAIQELLNSKNEDRKCFEAFMEMIDVQVKEMKTMNEAIRKFEKAREQDRLIEECVQSATTNGTTNNSWKPKQDRQADRTQNIMAMVQRGEMPPNIMEINDMPPYSNQPPSKPLVAPRMKPWEFTQQNSGENGQLQDASSDPWLRNKSVKITELEPEEEEPLKKLPYNTGASEITLSQRIWVPPQPPSVALAEAAAAIRHPKSLPPIQKQHSDNGVAAGSSNAGIDNESFNTSSVALNNSEIEEERADGT